MNQKCGYLSALLVLVAASVAAAADVPSEPIATKGKLLFSDDFARAESGKSWRANVPSFNVADGVLRVTQTRSDHGAVCAVKAGIGDGVVEFKFRLEGARAFNAVFDDDAYKGSHAGHLCRVAFSPTQIRLGDDKEGIMRNDIFEMSRDPKRKAEADKLLVGRGVTVPATIEPHRWYRVSIELAGDAMRVSLDGKPVAYLKSPGLAHPTKDEFHFTVSGQDALFDDVTIWAAAPPKGN